jgi:hypothetical protein
MIKLLMGLGASRNNAVWVANQCDGAVSHIDCFSYIIAEYIKFCRRQQAQRIIDGDLTGEPAGIVGSMYE